MNLKLNFVLFLGLIVVSVRTSDLEKDDLNGDVISKKERTEEEKQKYKYWKVRLLKLIIQSSFEFLNFRKNTKTMNQIRSNLKMQQWKLSLKTLTKLKRTIKSRVKVISKA